ncbi:MAG: HAD-IB family phosphatase [Patescibacteria group bacterium]
MKRFAAFDIDGTIFRWQLYHELFDALVDKQVIPIDIASVVFEARENWRNRTIDYDTYEMTLVRMMRTAIVGIDGTLFGEIADDILQAKGHHVYRYTLELLQRLKSEGYVIIAISGSYQQLVDRFSTLHDIDIAVGRDHVIENGKLTAQSTDIFGRKDEILQAIVRTHKLDWKGSYAVGDSSGDTAMLRLVEHPIAFNPDVKLKHEAMEQGWKIVIERKSIAYELQKGTDGSYVLA